MALRVPLKGAFLAWAGLFLGGPAVVPAAAGTIARAQQEELPPLTRVAGSWSISLTTTVEFLHAEERPHELQIDFAFPQRARWLLKVADAGEDRRVLLWQVGKELWSMAPGEGKSVPVPGRDLPTRILSLEIKRALLVWPEGFQWTETPLGRRSEVPDAGYLLAKVNEEGRLLQLESRLLDDSVWEQLSEIESATAERRLEPKAWLLSAHGQPLWRETVRRLDRSRRYLDSYFTPPDRRRGSSAPSSVDLSLLLPERMRRTFELEGAGLPSEKLLADLRQKAEASLPKGQTLQAGHGLEPGKEGGFARVFFEADGRFEQEGWRALPPRNARARRAPHDSGAWAEGLADLARPLPGVTSLWVWVGGPGGAELLAELGP